MKIITLIQNYRNRPFIKNMSVVMSGTAIAQLIGFAMTPVISRLFSPADFGIFGSFNSILSVAAAGVTLQYSQAVMLPKQNEEAVNVFGASVLSVFLISLISILIAYIFSDWLINILNVSQSKWILYLLPLAILINGLNQSFQAWCVRRKAFRKTASSQMIRAGSANLMQVISGFFEMGSVGLIGSSITADGIASLNLTKQALGSDKVLLKSSLSWERIRGAFIKYRDFPIYSTTQNVMNSLSQGLPVLLLAHFYGVTIAGAYAFGIRLLIVPFNFIAVGLRQVLFQKVSETYNNGNPIYPLFIKTTFALATLSFLPSIIFVFLSSNIFAWLFGEQWRLAGEYAGWLVIWLMVAFCNIPSVLFARVIKKQRQLFVYEFFQLILRAGSLIVGGMFLEAYKTVMLFSIVGIISNFLLIVWVANMVKFNTILKN